MNYESVIGLEVHVQIKTESKLFCGCPTLFGSPPNSNICPVCCGYPGVLPVLNKKAVEGLVRTAFALDCKINEESVFARKQYFYPDLPKNYQISQYEKPLAEHGVLEIFSDSNPKRIGITRIHLEEDAGKLIHSLGSTALDHSLIDLNRTGIPLMEIVSEPDLRSAEESQEYLSSLKMILQYLEVSDCDMEKGTLRCDANISIRPEGSKNLGTKVELKNMNSFKAVSEAIKYEIERQIQCVESGEKIVQETRLWNADEKQSKPMRSKEEAHDYRYFPEPDLLPLNLHREWIQSIQKNLPELPSKKRDRFIREFELSAYDAGVLTADKKLSDFYEKAVGPHDDISKGLLNSAETKILSNWITTNLLGRLNAENKTINESPISPENMGRLVRLIADGTISGKIAKTVFDEMWNSNENPKKIIEKKGLTQNSNETQIEKWVEESMSANPKAVQEYKNGKPQAIGALVGTVMKLSKGQANPSLVNQLLKKKLE